MGIKEILRKDRSSPWGAPGKMLQTTRESAAGDKNWGGAGPLKYNLLDF